MKKLFSIIFLSVFFYSTIGYYPAFLISKFNIKKEARVKISENPSESVLLALKIKDDIRDRIEWKGEDEFMLDGQMYDIVRKEKADDGHIIFYCFIDHKESKLLDNFERHVKSNMTEQASGNEYSNLLNSFNLDYLKPYKFFFADFSENFDQFSFYRNFYHSINPENISPPPELA